MIDLIARVTIIAVGISKYQDRYLPNLKGPYKDIEKLKYVLTKNQKTAAYSANVNLPNVVPIISRQI